MHQVPRIILEQLGGKRFLAMTGASHLVGSETALTFALPSTPHCVRGKINRVRVTLDPSDAYTVTYFRVQRGVWLTVEEDDDVYADALQESFTRVTGLATHL